MSNQVIALERQRDDAKLAIKRRNDILSLKNDPKFKEHILDGFTVRECARYARESADPALSERQRNDAMAMSQAAGHLLRFLNAVVAMGNQAEDNMVDIESALDEARAADAAEESAGA